MSATRCRWVFVLGCALAAARPLAAQVPGRQPPIVEGIVYDTISGRPLQAAVLRDAETGASTLTDERGRYTLPSAGGVMRLEVRRIGYQATSVSVTVDVPIVSRNIYLRPIPIGLAPITVVAQDDFALRLVVRAIARKHQLYAHIHDYRYNAYVKFVVRDMDQHPDSAASVLLITETRTSAYWEQPNHYQETILARRQSRNLSPRENLFSVGDIPNFSRDRIDLQKYSFVSPIADDAPDHYQYRVLDTLVTDGRRVFRLAIAPRTESSPLFVGMIDIADSSYDVFQIDVGTNRAVRLNIFRNLRYQQRLADVGGGRWMPYEIRFTGEVSLALPLPGFPEHMQFEQTAALDSFRFDEGHPPPDLGEFRLVVRDRADRADTSVWRDIAVPLTAGERAAWARIDSLRNLPAPVGYRVAEGFAAALRIVTDPDFFHFDRAEGTYLGVGHTWVDWPGWVVRTKLGYAEDSRDWEYRFGAMFRVLEEQRLWIGASYHDETLYRPTLASEDFRSTYGALFWRVDPLDYFRDRGLIVSLNSKLFDFTELSLHFNDVQQSSLPVVTDYAVFSVSRPQRANPLITAGHLRSISGNLAYDSRPMLRDDGQDYYVRMLTRTHLSFGFEVSSPSFASSDFDYRRYQVRFERRQRLFNLGITTITAAGGIAQGVLPPQRDFIVDFGMETPIGVDLGLLPPQLQYGGFNTLNQTNFGGNRAALITVRHDFDRLLFAKSGLPLIRSLPCTFSIHGGVFWTEFYGQPPTPGDSLLQARKPYTEVGFGLGNLTPFLSPFNCIMRFTWQLSSYATSRFQFITTVTGL
ncbi:MAG TPA: DUF5686 family protein [Gemmatimonadales bacterium]|nr:DUF5686 family protein [Gemmatimonadales bacterium]